MPINETYPNGVLPNNGIFKKKFNIDVPYSNNSFLQLLFQSGFDAKFVSNNDALYFVELIDKLNSYNAIYLIDWANLYNLYKDNEKIDGLKQQIQDKYKQRNYETDENRELLLTEINQLNVELEKENNTLPREKTINKIINHNNNSKELNLNNLYILCNKESIKTYELHPELSTIENILCIDASINCRGFDDFIFWVIAILLSQFIDKKNEKKNCNNNINNSYSFYNKDTKKNIERNNKNGLKLGPSLYLVTNDQQKLYDFRESDESDTSDTRKRKKNKPKNLWSELINCNFDHYFHIYINGVQNQYIEKCLVELSNLLSLGDNNPDEFELDPYGSENYNKVFENTTVSNINDLKVNTVIQDKSVPSFSPFKIFAGLIYYLKNTYYTTISTEQKYHSMDKQIMINMFDNLMF
jgi:hypothetical protein